MNLEDTVPVYQALQKQLHRIGKWLRAGAFAIALLELWRNGCGLQAAVIGGGYVAISVLLGTCMGCFALGVRAVKEAEQSKK